MSSNEHLNNTDADNMDVNTDFGLPRLNLGLDLNPVVGVQDRIPRTQTSDASPSSGSVSDTNNMLLMFMQQQSEMSRRSQETIAALLTRLQPPSAPPAETYRIMPDLAKSIDNFNGSGDSTKAREWLRTLEAVAKLHRWPDSFILESARSHLIDGWVMVS